MTTEMLLEAIERGAVDFDDLIPESTQAWTYFADPPHALCRFAATDDPLRDPSALGWYWQAHTDTWRVWSRATYDVFLPGGYWEDCADADAAKAEIRAWLASVG